MDVRRHRRDLLRGALATAVAAGLPSLGRTAGDSPPVLGIVLPPASQTVPPEGPALYGGRLRFLARGLGIERMTPADFDRALQRLPEVATGLAAAGAEAILVAGTSLSFYQGEAYNRELCKVVERTTGLPCTTMSDGVIAGLAAVDARRIAVATAYNDDVNARLAGFLREHGLEPLVVTGLGIEAMTDLEKVTPEDLRRFGRRVHASQPSADALLLSCGGFRTLELVAPLEADIGVPVVSSLPHALWAGARLCGIDPAVPGHGRVLALSPRARAP
ncbi:MAG: hypothetical protein RL026_359 [Pseudomonadota bacterium]|jgi:arylmalonate decarboxylase